MSAVTKNFDPVKAPSAPILVAKFQDRNGLPMSPDTVSLTVVAPDGTQTVYTQAGGDFDTPETGTYEKSVSMPTDGVYRWLWIGSSASPLRVIALDGRIAVLPFE